MIAHDRLPAIASDLEHSALSIDLQGPGGFETESLDQTFETGDGDLNRVSLFQRQIDGKLPEGQETFECRVELRRDRPQGVARNIREARINIDVEVLQLVLERNEGSPILLQLRPVQLLVMDSSAGLPSEFVMGGE